MLKKITKIIWFFILLLELCYFFTHSKLWYDLFIETTKLWLYKVVVAIIPMYILSSLILMVPFFSNVFYSLIKHLRLFENQKALSLFIISILTGNPTACILVKKAYLNKVISLNQANLIIKSSSHISLLFIVIFFKKDLAFIFLLSQILTTFILYIISARKKLFSPYTINIFTSDNHFSDNINTIIEDIPLILLKILATMLMVSLFKMPFMMLHNPFLNSILNFLELTTGVNDFYNSNLNIIMKIILISSLLSLNGGAIMLQVANVIKKTSLSYPLYLKGRLIHAFISIILSLVIYLIF